MKPSGIESATFPFVTKHFNHCATAVAGYIYSVLTLSVFVLSVKKKSLNFPDASQIYTDF